jgi:flavin-dependent dehydrogenase
VETVEHLIVGAGPAGLRAGQVLAEAGREALVVEKRAEIGPKTCAGGLTPKTVTLLRGLGLPAEAGLERVGQVGFAPGRLHTLDPGATQIVTISRRELGRQQAAWTSAAGAEVRVSCPVRHLDLRNRTALVGETRIGWRQLVGADGADSAVRRALGLPSPRACFAAEYNLPGVRLEPLRVECDPDLGGGYFWVFPHRDYTSIGAVAHKHTVRPPVLRRYLDTRVRGLGLVPVGERLEAATLETEFRGFHFAGGAHLAGDAAGVPSALTAEGIYSALITGEEVARAIVDPACPARRSTRWLRVKRRQDRLATLMRWRAARIATLALLDLAAGWQAARRPLADWFLAG